MKTHHKKTAPRNVPTHEKCEGCKKPAVTSDSEGIPLCQECFDDLVKSHGCKLRPAKPATAAKGKKALARVTLDERAKNDAQLQGLYKEGTIEAAARRNWFVHGYKRGYRAALRKLRAIGIQVGAAKGGKAK